MSVENENFLSDVLLIVSDIFCDYFCKLIEVILAEKSMTNFFVLESIIVLVISCRIGKWDDNEIWLDSISRCQLCKSGSTSS